MTGVAGQLCARKELENSGIRKSMLIDLTQQLLLLQQTRTPYVRGEGI